MFEFLAHRDKTPTSSLQSELTVTMIIKYTLSLPSSLIMFICVCPKQTEASPFSEALGERLHFRRIAASAAPPSSSEEWLLLEGAGSVGLDEARDRIASIRVCRRSSVEGLPAWKVNDEHRWLRPGRANFGQTTKPLSEIITWLSNGELDFATLARAFGHLLNRRFYLRLHFGRTAFHKRAECRLVINEAGALEIDVSRPADMNRHTLPAGCQLTPAWLCSCLTGRIGSPPVLSAHMPNGNHGASSPTGATGSWRQSCLCSAQPDLRLSRLPTPQVSATLCSCRAANGGIGGATTPQAELGAVKSGSRWRRRRAGSATLQLGRSKPNGRSSWSRVNNGSRHRFPASM